ncbi:MAG: kelch repeat-containing protein [Acidimicrobiales bacterium]
MPTSRSAARERARRRRQRRFRRTVAVTAVVVLAAVVAISRAATSGGHRSGPTSTASAAAAHHNTDPPSIEAGVEAWPLPQPVSRASVVATGGGLVVLGGLTAAGTSSQVVARVDTTTGTVSADGTLAAGVHDAAASAVGSSVMVLGGGSPATVPTVQSILPAPGATGTVSGQLPQPRSDLAAVDVGGTTYVVGGYDGTTYLPDVLATTDGAHFRTVAHLPVPVRYPAVAALGGKVYVFGGETAAPGGTAATADIQVVDPATGTAEVVGHLPRARYGAAAFVVDHHLYVAGGQVPNGPTLTAIDAFVPASGKVLAAGLLPQAEAFGAYTATGGGRATIGWIIGGEVAAQSGPDAAGVASGALSTVISLRVSPYGGPAGSPGAGSPYRGTLLIADRGSNRIIAIDAQRNRTWTYPGPGRPAPPGGFYFPDDAFFVRHGTAIISNQENNDTIVEIGYPSGKLLWQYGHPKVPGNLPGYLNQPDDAYLQRSGIVTVADASNNRILFIDPNGNKVVGQIGNGTDAHVPGVSIAYPNGDTPLADGNVLVSEINGSWIDEYTPTGRMVWSVQMKSVNYPSDPQQISADLYLMTDYNPPGEGRILEFTRQGRVVWRYDATSGDGMLKMPSLAERLPSGLIMVNDDYNDRVVAIDPSTDCIVWQYGLTGVAGTAPGLLSTPDGFDVLAPGGVTPTHPQTG